MYLNSTLFAHLRTFFMLAMDGNDIERGCDISLRSQQGDASLLDPLGSSVQISADNPARKYLVVPQVNYPLDCCLG